MLATTAAPHPKLRLPPHYSLTWLGSASAYLDTTRSHALQPSGCVVRHVLRLATPHASSTLVAPLPYLPSTRSCTQPRYPEFWTRRALDALCATQRRLKRYLTSYVDLMPRPRNLTSFSSLSYYLSLRRYSNLCCHSRNLPLRYPLSLLPFEP